MVLMFLTFLSNTLSKISRFVKPWALSHGAYICSAARMISPSLERAAAGPRFAVARICNGWRQGGLLSGCRSSCPLLCRLEAGVLLRKGAFSAAQVAARVVAPFKLWKSCLHHLRQLWHRLGQCLPDRVLGWHARGVRFSPFTDTCMELTPPLRALCLRRIDVRHRGCGSRGMGPSLRCGGNFPKGVQIRAACNLAQGWGGALRVVGRPCARCAHAQSMILGAIGARALRYAWKRAVCRAFRSQ